MSDFLHGLKEWQDLASGLIGFIAAIGAIWFALFSDRRREHRELQGLKVALVAEMAGMINRAFDLHRRAVKEMQTTGTGLVAHTIASVCSFADPVVYSNNASKVGALEQSAHDVVLFYTRITIAKSEGLRMAQELREQSSMSGMENAVDIADALIVAAAGGADVARRLARGPDAKMLEKMQSAISEQRQKWDAWKTEWEALCARERARSQETYRKMAAIIVGQTGPTSPPIAY